MLYVSRFVSDRDRDPELWATIWQAKAPPTLNLIGAYNLGGDERVFIWEGETTADLQFMDSFNDVGRLDTSPAFDRTVGWKHAFAANIAEFEVNMRSRSLRTEEQIQAGLDLRRRGMSALTPQAARRRAREWAAEQEAADMDD
ncbi:MAG: hypothetical protein HOC77_13705 [Chloroflexi bacterium]|jgi:hypothetical protein|nr:hypothetical protein [Chloroflexota bacterium]MBT4073457.1 hypothetical protein [Chloroflexota bacterium]MBT4516131.1 hypothetical protein [Chloroflexota bacterium]MBT5319999.1 hypothetical protein [Chloroflexota bacterium]MBT6682256.1 hypothetical protein [Chloroflexota bacterium]